MDRIGLINRIMESTEQIYTGRHLLDIDGFEREGRINYRERLADAMELFNDAQLLADNDLALLIQSELAFITQELQFCASDDKETSSSLKQAIQSFDDALSALQVVEQPEIYRGADLTYPHQKKYRYKDVPRDSLHIACMAHHTRLGNILRAPGINMAEKALLTKRRSNLKTAQAVYLKKQKAILSNAQA